MAQCAESSFQLQAPTAAAVDDDSDDDSDGDASSGGLGLAEPHLGPHERVRSLLKKHGAREEEDGDNNMRKMLEMCRDHLSIEARELKEANDEQAVSMAARASVEERIRARSSQLDSVFAVRLERKVTAALDLRVNEIRHEMHHRSCDGAGAVVLNSGVNLTCGRSSPVTDGTTAHNIERRWRSQAPWTATPAGRAAKVGGGLPRSEMLRRSVQSGSGAPPTPPQAAASPAWRQQAHALTPAGRPSPGRNKLGSSGQPELEN